MFIDTIAQFAKQKDAEAAKASERIHDDIKAQQQLTASQGSWIGKDEGMVPQSSVPAATAAQPAAVPTTEAETTATGAEMPKVSSEQEDGDANSGETPNIFDMAKAAQ